MLLEATVFGCLDLLFEMAVYDLILFIVVLTEIFLGGDLRLIG
jgi:hypothetical protein